MTFRVRFDDKKFVRLLDRDLKRQAPFAMSRTLKAIAFDARAEAQRNIQSEFEGGRGKYFVKRSVFVNRSSKTNLRGETGLLERAGFFAVHETGGTRRPKGRYLAVRKEARSGRPGRVLQRPRVYQSCQGIFQRLRNTTRQLWQ